MAIQFVKPGQKPKKFKEQKKIPLFINNDGKWFLVLDNGELLPVKNPGPIFPSK